jgi:hypothetical protein
VSYLRAGRTRGLPLVLTVALAGCAVGPRFKSPAPPAAADYGSAAVAGATAAAAGAGGDAQRFITDLDIPAQWWTLFRSTKLDQLVEQALKGNPTVGAAQAALRQARELYAAQRSTLLPSVQGSLDANRSRFAVNSLANPTVSPNPTYTLYTAQLSLSYALDVLGGNRRAVEAAQAQAEVSRFQLEAAYLTLSSNVVVTAIQEAPAGPATSADQHRAPPAGARHGEHPHPARAAVRRSADRRHAATAAEAARTDARCAHGAARSPAHGRTTRDLSA